MKLYKKFFSKLRRVVPPILFLVVTYFIFMPCSLFLGNINEFAVDFVEVVPIVAAVSLIVFAVLIVFGFLLINEKAFNIYVTLIFGVALGFYVQGNFLNPKFGLLDGQTIDWSTYMPETIISVIVWTACIIVPQVLLYLKKDWIKLIRTWGSYALCAMQITALVVAIFTTKKTESDSVMILKQDEFVLSSKENIVVFIVDTLDGQYYDDIIVADENEEYKTKLKDFTYYDNCVAGGAPTRCGVPAMLTGTTYEDLSQPYMEYQAEAYKNSKLFKDLKKNNYAVKLFTEPIRVEGVDVEDVDNLVSAGEYEISSFSGFGSLLYDITGFYAMPMPLKKYFWFYSGDFSKYVNAKEYDCGVYDFDDSLFYEEYKEQGITLEDDKNVFTYYHLRGAHPPYVSNEELKEVPSEETSRAQQTMGVFKLIYEYIDEMKEEGVYDNSTIIIAGDHGETQLYQHASILVKKKNEHKEYTINSSPVMFDNLYATFASAFLDDYSSYGEALEDVKDEPRDRYHTTHIVARYYLKDDEDVQESEYARFCFKGHARDMSQCIKVSSTNTAIKQK